ncbi:cytochrome P450 [Labilithrix luteola]|nr:cytochrome P450 [Labilithrix luteola]
MLRLHGFASVDIRGPRALPLVGTARRFISFLDDPVGVVLALRRMGDVVAVVDRNPAIVCVFGPERNREVLSDPDTFHNPEDFFTGPDGSAREKMRAMVVTSNGADHRRRRRLMMPAFHRSALDGYAEEIVTLTRSLVGAWPRGEVVSLDGLCRELSLCIAVQCFYGVDVKRGASVLGQTMAEFVRLVTSPANILFPFDLPGTPYRRGVQIGEDLASRMLALVESKRQSGGQRRDAMGLLLDARDEHGNGLTADEIVALAVELFIAGSETSSMALTWCLLLLDQHPRVLEALAAELSDVLGERDPSPADLPKLRLLDRVVKETLRVLPAAPILFLRSATRDTMLGGKAIPKGANLVVSPLATHHDASLYPDPDRFLPDRWKEIEPSTYAYFPFGAGPRMCAGALFASQSVRLMLAMILQRFHPRTVDAGPIDRRVRANILNAQHGVHARLCPVRANAAPAAPVRGNIHELVKLESRGRS